MQTNYLISDFDLNDPEYSVGAPIQHFPGNEEPSVTYRIGSNK